MTIEEFYEFKESLAIELTELLKERQISDRDVMIALYLLKADEEGMEWIGDVWDLNITYDEALQLLKNFDFEALTQQIEIEEGAIPREFVLEKKARFKASGSIWVIHKNDADPFPSNPHAHNVELNQKLDLSNGNCYHRKKLLFKIDRKNFLKIRKKAEGIYKGRLPELALK